MLNLDLDSAKYDPKTRSMIDMGAQADQASALVAEDNFIRASGDAAEFERAQRYAWESQERGDKTQHLQANPTFGEIRRRKQIDEKDVRRDTQRKALLDKYGGEEHIKPSPLGGAAVLENERFVEYDETGAIKGQPKRAAKSKYAEDLLTNNHTSVWGSWWSNFQWGYSCCHSTVKNSYCTGEEGMRAFEEADNIMLTLEVAGTAQIANANVDDDRNGVSGKRDLRQFQQGVTEEELESYKRSRLARDDPMAALLGKDQLI